MNMLSVLSIFSEICQYYRQNAQDNETLWCSAKLQFFIVHLYQHSMQLFVYCRGAVRISGAKLYLACIASDLL